MMYLEQEWKLENTQRYKFYEDKKENQQRYKFHESMLDDLRKDDRRKRVQKKEKWIKIESGFLKKLINWCMQNIEVKSNSKLP